MQHVRGVMTEQVTIVRPDAPLQDVARIMRDEDIGSVPVADNDTLRSGVRDRTMRSRRARGVRERRLRQ
jgi:CBS domain-containing protein